jgi:hypothetical protein
MTTDTTIEVSEAADAAEKARILDLLTVWIHQRPGLDYGNYGDPALYRAEVRGITRQLHDARTLLRAVRWRGITGAMLRAAFDSGRLSYDPITGLDYTTGQYWPTEYRRAACRVLASALWRYQADHCMPAPTLHHNSETGELVQRYKGERAGDYLRGVFRKEYGRGLAGRYFN